MSSSSSRTLPGLLLAFVWVGSPVLALALQGGSPPAVLERPRSSLLPQDEDWSVLRDVDRDELEGTDRLKFVPLDAEGRWLADTDDALYNAGGGVVRPGGSADSSWVGNELDLTARYTFDRHLSALLGYSHFFAGDAIRQSGSSQDIDFVYLSLQYAF